MNADLTDAERQFLTFALDLAADEMASRDGFTDEDHAALETFRRMAAEPDAAGTTEVLASIKNADTPAADFYQPGHTYADPEHPQYDWQFRCDLITTHPENGERTALGWRHFRGEWDAIAYGEDDWDVSIAVGLTDLGAES